MPFAASANGGSSTPFGSLLVAVFGSILEVVLICAAGYILASKGILDKKTQKQLNRLNVSLFTPALLFSKVALYLTPEKLKELWVIPLWFLTVTSMSMLVGSVLGWLFKLKSSQKSFVMAAAMFMNSNALPIALMQSLVVSVSDLRWTPDDNKNAMLGRALTYLTMYSTLGMVVRYSYGVRLLARADTILVAQEPQLQPPDERTPLLRDAERLPSAPISTHPSTSTLISEGNPEIVVSSPKAFNIHELPPARREQEATDASASTTASTTFTRPLGPRRKTTFYRSFPNSPNDSTTNLGHYTDVSSDSDSDADALPSHVNDYFGAHDASEEEERRPKRKSFAHRFFKSIRSYWAAFNDFMTVPLWAAMLSLFVACIPALQHALTHHLMPVNDAINTAGKCSVPLTLVVLGAYFYPEPIDDPTQKTKDKRSVWQKVKSVLDVKKLFRDDRPEYIKRKEAPKPGETKTVILAVAARMFITPLLIMPLVFLATKYDFHRVFADPVFVVCNIILLASPPALTLAQITQAVSGDAFERLISRTIFWSYCVCTPPVTIVYVVMGLFLAKLEA
ncbi:endoplasmic reticulum protein [Coprinopsis sp. MPI-PUGE-AT-0042]|nr:endoplasmic reticulum protein [Coprinopsis sp. MPI-PUGE-AT-0042]